MTHSLHVILVCAAAGLVLLPLPPAGAQLGALQQAAAAMPVWALRVDPATAGSPFNLEWLVWAVRYGTPSDAPCSLVIDAGNADRQEAARASIGFYCSVVGQGNPWCSAVCACAEGAWADPGTAFFDMGWCARVNPLPCRDRLNAAIVAANGALSDQFVSPWCMAAVLSHTVTPNMLCAPGTVPQAWLNPAVPPHLRGYQWGAAVVAADRAAAYINLISNLWSTGSTDSTLKLCLPVADTQFSYSVVGGSNGFILSASPTAPGLTARAAACPPLEYTPPLTCAIPVAAMGCQQPTTPVETLNTCAPCARVGYIMGTPTLNTPQAGAGGRCAPVPAGSYPAGSYLIPPGGAYPPARPVVAGRNTYTPTGAPAQTLADPRWQVGASVLPSSDWPVWCPDNYWSPGGATACAPCNAGMSRLQTYHVRANYLSCLWRIDAVWGTYNGGGGGAMLGAFNGYVPPEAITACLSGSAAATALRDRTWDNLCAYCPAGWASNGGGNCVQCPPFAFLSPAYVGLGYTRQFVRTYEACSVCPPGSVYSGGGGGGGGYCGACTGGFMRATLRASVTLVYTEQTYNGTVSYAQPGALASVLGTACLSGGCPLVAPPMPAVAPALPAGVTACVDCVEGTMATGASPTACVACPAFSTWVGGQGCVPCAAGTQPAALAYDATAEAALNVLIVSLLNVGVDLRAAAGLCTVAPGSAAAAGIPVVTMGGAPAWRPGLGYEGTVVTYSAWGAMAEAALSAGLSACAGLCSAVTLVPERGGYRARGVRGVTSVFAAPGSWVAPGTYIPPAVPAYVSDACVRNEWFTVQPNTSREALYAVFTQHVTLPRTPLPPAALFSAQTAFASFVQLPATCAACAVGTFGPGGVLPCIACPVLSFANTTGAAACTPCPINTWAPARGAAACVPCPLGYSTSFPGGVCINAQGQAAGNFTIEAPCPPGSRVAAARVSGSVVTLLCELCAPGTFANASTALATACVPCPGGTVALGAGATQCGRCPGAQYVLPSGAACAACPPNAVQDPADGGACQACPPGTSRPVEGGACAPCAPNTYAPAPGSACRPCGTNTYSAFVGAAACTACPPNTYRPAGTETAACGLCAPGTYGGASACLPCPFGTVSAAAGARECTPCPPAFVAVGGGTACLFNVVPPDAPPFEGTTLAGLYVGLSVSFVALWCARPRAEKHPRTHLTQRVFTRT